MKERLEELRAAALIAAAALALHVTGIGCPIRFLTGVSCAGCGMTRALFAALRGNFAEAFRFHPLFPLVPAAIFLWCFRGRIGPKTKERLLAAFIAAFLIVYVVRMLLPGSVVVFRPQDGAVFRFIRRCIHVLCQLR